MLVDDAREVLGLGRVIHAFRYKTRPNARPMHFHR